MKEYEHLKAVIWNRDKVEGLHRYVIVGMIVTDHEIENLENNEVVIDGQTFGLLRVALQDQNTRQSKVRVGDASDALLRLNEV